MLLSSIAIVLWGTVLDAHQTCMLILMTGKRTEPSSQLASDCFQRHGGTSKPLTTKAVGSRTKALLEKGLTVPL